MHQWTQRQGAAAPLRQYGAHDSEYSDQPRRNRQTQAELFDDIQVPPRQPRPSRAENEVESVAPILAADTAMAHARALDGPPSHDEVRCWLDGVEPGDFAAGVPLDPPAPTD